MKGSNQFSVDAEFPFRGSDLSETDDDATGETASLQSTTHAMQQR